MFNMGESMFDIGEICIPHLCAYWRLCLKGENSCPKREKRILALFVLRCLRESFLIPFFFGRSSLVGCFFSHRYFEVQRRDS